jgi:hypothetical protein
MSVTLTTTYENSYFRRSIRAFCGRVRCAMLRGETHDSRDERRHERGA